MKTVLSIAIGGSLGALSRFYLSKAVFYITGGIFPWGTMIINLAGCFLIGLFFNLFDKTIVPEELKIFVTVGFLGAFTTFSAFALENMNFLRGGEIKAALFNVFVSNACGLIFAFLGFYLIEFIFLIIIKK